MNILGLNNVYEWMRISIPNQYTVNIIYPEKSGFTVRALKPGQANKIPKFERCFLRGQVRSTVISEVALLNLEFYWSVSNKT